MNDLEISLTKEACLACGSLIDGPIILNSILSRECAEKVKELHGQCIGYSEELCDKCKEYCDLGLLIIEIDEEKSEPNNPYRTGSLWVIGNDSDLAKHLLTTNFIINKGGCKFVFIDKEVTKQIGLRG